MTKPTATTIPDVPVVAWKRKGKVWHLSYTVPCPFCNAMHRHGGGDGPEPSYGIRGAHCLRHHKAFRPDCKPEKNASREPRGEWCYTVHGPEDINLVPATPRFPPVPELDPEEAVG